MKEKIYNFFTNKVFIIVLLFIAILFSFASNCFASSYNGSCNDEDFSIVISDNISSNYPYIILYSYYSSGSYDYIYSIYLASEPFYLNQYNQLITSSSSGYYYFETVSSYPLTTIDLSNKSISNFSNGFATSFVCLNNPTWLDYINFDLQDSNGNVVFQQAPAQEGQQQGETVQGTALTLEQVEEIPQAMTQTLQVVIPVGLAIFGIGLVIFLMRYLILRLM